MAVFLCRSFPLTLFPCSSMDSPHGLQSLRKTCSSMGSPLATVPLGNIQLLQCRVLHELQGILLQCHRAPPPPSLSLIFPLLCCFSFFLFLPHLSLFDFFFFLPVLKYVFRELLHSWLMGSASGGSVAERWRKSL